MNVLYWRMQPAWPQQHAGFKWKGDSYPYGGKYDLPLCCLNQIRATDFWGVSASECPLHP